MPSKLRHNTRVAKLPFTLRQSQALCRTDMAFYAFLNPLATETPDIEISKFQVHFPLAEWHHNSLLIEMGLAEVTSWGQRVAFLVAIEGIQTDWEAEGMEDFMLHCWQQYLEFLWFCADTLWTQVGVSCYRSANQTQAPQHCIDSTKKSVMFWQTLYTNKELKFDVCLTVHHWYKYCRRPTRCNNNGLLIFQSAQHVSDNFLSILRSARLFTASGIMHPSCCRPVAWNAEALTMCSVRRMLR